MTKFTRWLAAKAIRDYQSVGDLKVRARYGALEGWTSIVVNVVLFAVKMGLGLAIGSVSLIADAIHTLADSATSVVLVISFKMAKKPSDREHPFGHGRLESVAALVVSVLLFVAGAELFETAVRSIAHPQSSRASVAVILLIAGTLVVKELLSRFSYQLGDMIDSQALKADALHHRSDVLATALVVLALIGSRFGYDRIDGAAGVLVSLIIFYAAYSIAREAVNPLLGVPPPRDTLSQIGSLAKAHQGVLGVHDIIFHSYGQTNVISLHLEVSDQDNIASLHALSEAVEEDIARKIGATVIAHIDPINREHPQYEAIAETIREIVSQDERVHSFHDLRIIGCRANRCNVVFDIVLEADADEQKTHDIIRSIREKFAERFPEMRTIIKAEPKYAYTPVVDEEEAGTP